MKKIFIMFYFINFIYIYSFYHNDVKRIIDIKKEDNNRLLLSNEKKSVTLIITEDHNKLFSFFSLNKKTVIDLNIIKNLYIFTTDGKSFNKAEVFKVSIEDKALNEIIKKYNKIDKFYLNTDLKNGISIPYDEELTDKVKSLKGLETIESANLIILKSINNLEHTLDLSPLKNLYTVKDSFDLSNRKIINYDSLNFRYIGQNLNLSNCQIENTEFLNNIKYVGSDLNLSENKIVEISGINNLTKVNGSIFLNENKIKKITGLQNLKFIGGDFLLTDNSINHISGLNKLNIIKRNLVIDKNNSLYKKLILKTEGKIYY